ncbi:VOC family protein [Spongiactinospora sp. TRM90649]|uniref:VOC family protein n=1 Tax=Spongiactinospora sp. TRM90649 TaxID=3031114 RepID=UPI0023F8F920|nr:VOC family protein [Spongiactinospora sp. TRM90649]MDF5758136.1 VOC family protein [Spongiactinospora sp. TRM90649]
MTDPFEVLREPAGPVDPDPLFAERLRAALERAVLDPTTVWRGDDMTTATGTGLRHGDIGYASLLTPDVGRAADFYEEVLGWEYGPSPRGRRVEGVTPSFGVWEGEDNTVLPCFAVDDVAEAVRRVGEAGGGASPAVRKPYGLIAHCLDDQGLRFAVYEPAGDPRPVHEHARQGDLAYVTIEVPDSAAARAFYGHVLGWEFIRGSVRDGWAVRRDGAEISPMTGMSGGAERPAVVPMYAVDDIRSAVATIWNLDGTAGEPQAMPYGLLAECADDQGSRFYLGQLPRP